MALLALRRSADADLPVGEGAACGRDREVESDPCIAQIVRRFAGAGVLDAVRGRVGDGVFKRAEQRCGLAVDHYGSVRGQPAGFIPARHSGVRLRDRYRMRSSPGPSLTAAVLDQGLICGFQRDARSSWSDAADSGFQLERGRHAEGVAYRPRGHGGADNAIRGAFGPGASVLINPGLSGGCSLA